MASGLRVLKIDFSRCLRPWDGFGINYVETSQTRDYDADPQDYGGFSILSETARAEIIEQVFGDDGLQPGLLKMFLDPFHQDEPAAGYAFGSPKLQPEFYDHEKTTRWMRLFACEGHRLTHARGEELAIIGTLYGPPGWMTRQGFCRGRDLRPECEVELLKYLAEWARYVRDDLGMPMQYLSLHNEGEDWMRWPDDGSTGDDQSHDYNLYWKPEQVCRLLPELRAILDANGLHAVGATPGETSNWVRFHHWGYADALANDAVALNALGLITSHGFWASYAGQWNADHRSAGIDLLRAHRPELHAWNTSSNWGKGFLYSVFEANQSIYSAKLNGIIPWAAVQRHALWEGGDPNPQTAFIVREDGSYEVTKEYYIYKQMTRAGRRGTHVAPVSVNDTEIYALAFSGVGSSSPDAFVLANIGSQEKLMSVDVSSEADAFCMYRTSHDEDYAEVGIYSRGDPICLPQESVTTFIAMPD